MTWRESSSVRPFHPACANATLSISSAVRPTGGITTEMAWDPARGMHYRTVLREGAVVEGTDVPAMLAGPHTCPPLPVLLPVLPLLLIRFYLEHPGVCVGDIL